MPEAIIAGAIVLLLIAGFWWTRGAGEARAAAKRLAEERG
jgi:hypothetical protein